MTLVAVVAAQFALRANLRVNIVVPDFEQFLRIGDAVNDELGCPRFLRLKKYSEFSSSGFSVGKLTVETKYLSMGENVKNYQNDEWFEDHPDLVILDVKRDFGTTVSVHPGRLWVSQPMPLDVALAGAA